MPARQFVPRRRSGPPTTYTNASCGSAIANPTFVRAPAEQPAASIGEVQHGQPLLDALGDARGRQSAQLAHAGAQLRAGEAFRHRHAVRQHAHQGLTHTSTPTHARVGHSGPTAIDSDIVLPARFGSTQPKNEPAGTLHVGTLRSTAMVRPTLVNSLVRPGASVMAYSLLM